MKSTMRKTLLRWCCIGLFLLLWCGSLAQVENIQQFAQSTGLRYEAEPGDSPQEITPQGITPREISRIRETAEKNGDSLPTITLWRQEKNQFLQNERMTASVSADGFHILGDAQTVLPLRFLQGSYPAESDIAGCAISRSIANALWGNEFAVGQSLYLDDKLCTVRGVFDEKSDLILLQADSKEKDVLFPNAELAFPNSDNAVTEAQSFLSKYQLQTPTAILDAPLLGQAAGLFGLLPAWLLGLVILARFLKRVLSLQHYPALCIPALLCSVALTPVILWALQISLQLPNRFIPPRWSDFSFFSRTAQDLLNQIKIAFSLPPTVRETALFTSVVFCGLCGIFAIFLLILSIERVRLETARQLAGGTVAVLVLLFSILLWFSAKGDAVSLPRAVWFALPLYFSVDFLLLQGNQLLYAKDTKGGVLNETTQCLS